MGKTKRSEAVTLSEAEAQNRDVGELEQPSTASTLLENRQGTVSLETPQDVPYTKDDHDAPPEKAAEPAVSKPQLTTTAKFPARDSTTRLYTTENRMWHALTGHGPDLGKVKVLDFHCLSIIAAHGKEGILQPDLVRISGQDKRSLPGRTDRLHETGYIEKKRARFADPNSKRPVLVTSRCILKRFVEISVSDRQQAQSKTQKSISTEDTENNTEDTHNDRVFISATAAPPAIAEDDGGEQTLPSSMPTPSPKWTMGKCISNQIFDIVDRSGTRGMTTTVSFC